jgi:hypothetical protein
MACSPAYKAHRLRIPTMLLAFFINDRDLLSFQLSPAAESLLVCNGSTAGGNSDPICTWT